jgi:RHS repeat-associated protein
MSRGLAAVLACIVATSLAGRANAQSSRGDGSQTGDGSTAFTGLSQAPEANMFFGAATTSIPIQVPPGRKQVTPQLALTYNSNAGPSPYGYGWDLPLPRIERSTKNGLLACSDTVGRQEFVLTLAGATVECTRQSSGICIPHVEEGFLRILSDPSSTNTWTVFDKGGTKYTFGASATASTDGGSSFSAAARTGGDALHDFATSTCAYTFSWALTSIVDPNGNTLDVKYLLISGVLYPYTVKWGGNTTGGLSHRFQAAFTWQDRTGDYELANSMSGFEALLTKRLQQIDIQYTPSGGAAQPIRSYVPSYTSARTGRQTFLESVVVKGDDGSVLAARDGDAAAPFFYYHTAQLGFAPSAQTPPVPTFRPPHYAPNDYGITAQHKIRWSQPEEGARRDVLDINGDGFPDLVDAWPVHTQSSGCVDTDVTADYWDVYLGSQAGFSTSRTQWYVPKRGVMCDLRRVGSPDTTNTFMTLLDMNGDGIPDFVDARNTPWTVYLGTPSSAGGGWGFDAGHTWTGAGSYPALAQRVQINVVNGWVGNRVVEDLIDMNGDGRPDLVQVQAAYSGQADAADPTPGAIPYDVWINTGAGFRSAETFYGTFRGLSFVATGNDPQNGMVYGTFDMNGDGLPDQVRSQRGPGTSFVNGSTGYLVCINRAHAADDCTTWPIQQFGSWRDLSRESSSQDVIRELIDINGDGLPDIVDSGDWSTNGHYWNALLNQGASFAATAVQVAAPSGQIRDGNSRTQESIAKDTFDADGDGALDFVDFTPTGTSYSVTHARNGAWAANGQGVSAAAGGVRTDLLVASDTGIGGSVFFRYRPSTQWVNTDPNGIPLLPFNVWTVTQISRDDGMCDDDGECSNDPSVHSIGDLYSYSGGRYDPVGRAFRGFKTVTHDTLTDGSTPRRTTTTQFIQAAALAGKIASTFDIDTATQAPLAYTPNLWQCADLLSGSAIVCPDEPGICTDSSGAIVACPPGPSADVWVRLRQTQKFSYGTSDTKISKTVNDSWASCGMNPYGTGSSYGNVQDVTVGAFDNSVVQHIHTDYYCGDGGSTSYIVDRPTHVITRKTDNATVLDEKWFTYNGTTGNLTIAESWLNQTYGPAPPACTNTPAAGGGGCAAVTTGYDSYGNVTSVKDALLRETRTGYDSATQIYPVTVTGPASFNHNVTSAYDPKCGTLLTQSIPYIGTTVPAEKTQHAYDHFCRRTDTWRPGESGTAYRHYAYLVGAQKFPSVLATYAREPNSGSGTIEATVLIDALGRVIQRKAQGEVDGAAVNTAVAMHHDGLGRMTEQSAPFTWSGSGTSFDTYSAPAAGTGKTMFAYDGLDRVVSQTNPDGTVRGMDYGVAWQTTTSDECYNAGGCAGGSQTIEQRDAFDRVIQRTQKNQSGATVASMKFDYHDGDANRQVTTTQYDTASSSWNTRTAVTTTYDTFGRKISVSDPDSGASTGGAGLWKYGYDIVGNLVYEDDPAVGQHLEYCYDALNRLAKKFVQTGDGYTSTSCSNTGRVAYTYNESQPYGLGLVATITDPAGQYSVLAYDVLGRVLREQRTISPVTETTTMAEMRYWYDAGDHLTQILYPDSEVVQYAYDGVGQVVSVTGLGTETYLVNLTYDLFGRPRAITHPKIEDRRTYAGASGNYRLTQIQTVAGTQTQTTRMQYDYAGYDALGRLTAINDTTPNKPSATDNGARYTYDALGLTNAQLPRLGNANFADSQNGYDNLTKKDNVSLTYDTSSATAKPHQPKMYNSSPIGHDDNGNRHSGPNGAMYEFDPEGRLNTAGNEAFDYDYAGRRVIRRVGSGLTTRYFNRLFEADSDGTITKYYYAGPLLIASTHKTNGQFAAADFHDAVRFAARSLRHGSAVVLLLRRDVQLGLAASVLLGATVLAIAPWGRRRRVVGLRVRHGHRIGAAVIVLTTLPWPIVLLPAPVDAQCQPQPIASHYSLDHLGSTQLVTTPTGDVDQYVRYKPYGDPSWFNSSGGNDTFNSTHRRLFTGYEWDPGTELYYAGARWYHPATATFLSHDPARQFASPYTYVNWDPVNRTDPNGALSNGWAIVLGIFLGPDAAAAIDASRKGASPGQALKAAAISFGNRGVPIGQSYGLNLIAPSVFGKPDPGNYAIGLIPIGGSAYGAIRSFHNGDYASGAFGAAVTLASIILLGYAIYQIYTHLGGSAAAADGSGDVVGGETDTNMCVDPASAKFPDTPQSGTNFLFNQRGGTVMAVTYYRGHAFATDSLGNHAIFSTQSYGVALDTVEYSEMSGEGYTNAFQVTELAGMSRDIGVSGSLYNGSVSVAGIRAATYSGWSWSIGPNAGVLPITPFSYIDYWRLESFIPALGI